MDLFGVIFLRYFLLCLCVYDVAGLVCSFG